MEDARGDLDETWRTFLVEHYWPGVTAQQFGDAAERVRASAEQLAASGERIRYLHSTLVPEDEAAYCVFEAASEDLVEQAYARAEVRFERMRAAVETVAASRGVGKRAP
jgi:hypothetical protein